jgi:transposase
MPRFIDYNYDQMKMLAVSYEKQILPGTFESSLIYLIDKKLDLTIFHGRYKNDDNGRPAYDPAILLKIVLLAYSRGITSSRQIERLCRENILFMAISADSQPNFTTLAEFISSSKQEIAQLFGQVLMICDSEGLIGKEMFAIDGCKLPSNASKEWSGTHDELKKKKAKIDKAVQYILEKHHHADTQSRDEDVIARERKQKEKLDRASQKIGQFLKTHEDRKGVSGNVVKSNITDNDSAKMKTSHGVIQGYTGVVAVDAKHQVIVQAHAYGQGQEHGLLEPTIEGLRANLNIDNTDVMANAKVVVDSGYHNQKALEYLEDNGIDGYIADTGFRARDPRFKDYKDHKPRDRLKSSARFGRADFHVDIDKQTCHCPAGNVMWLKDKCATINHNRFMQFQAYEKDCSVCSRKRECLKNETQRTPRQLNVLIGTTPERNAGVIERMKQKIDSDEGRAIYSRRLGIVEPVFANITDMIGIKRFSLRGKEKVNTQWQWMTIVHNIFKLHRYAWI